MARGQGVAAYAIDAWYNKDCPHHQQALSWLEGYGCMHRLGTIHAKKKRTAGQRYVGVAPDVFVSLYNGVFFFFRRTSTG